MVTRRPHPTHWTGKLRKAAVTLASVRGRPRRVVVSGDSMAPAFQADDRLVVVPVGRLERGNVVAVRDPRLAGRVLVKRVHTVDPGGIDVRGDNAAASTDSRHFGPVTPAGVVGRVVYRYHPPERSGWIAE